MKFNLYSAWMDPLFYLAAGLFAAALFFLVYSISKYLEIANSSHFEEESEEDADLQDELPLAGASAAGPAVVEPASAAAAAPEAASAPVQAIAEPVVEAAPVRAEPAQEAAHEVSKAEEFVKGLYQSMSSLDGRMKGIETALAKAKVNREFTVTFLEDMLNDFDALSKEKIKARIDYLLSDLKK
ncbi:MAG: hypothetical protein A3J79_06495 [Elusimicrobia bacterium RIFOXYB2_FULL_62_6]|nr:MAG: hypothetical protein A3J79_06495 [Elusimicrobia bacterium RIFOXYB2_FULL_62_6]